MSFLGSVNADAAEALAASTPNPTLTEKLKKNVQARRMSLDAFVRKLLKEGEDQLFGKNIGALLGFPDGAPTKLKQIEAEDTADHRGRSCNVVIDKSSEHGGKPVCLLILAKRIRGREDESHWFRVALDGSLETAFLSHMKYDENGKPVRGSGVKTDLDINAPETKALLQHELEFWLKGMHRRKAAAAPRGARAAPIAAAAGGTR